MEHAKQAAKGDQSEKAEYIRNIGSRLRYTVFLQCEDDAFARGYEAYLIHGHHDVLTNIAPASLAAIERMFVPICPFRKSLADLAAITKMLQQADQECKDAMSRIIAGCPEVIRKLSADDLLWMGLEPA